MLIRAMLIVMLLCSTGWATIDSDGTDDALTCGTGASIHDLGPLTFSVWINPDSFGGGSLGRIFETADTEAIGYRMFFLHNSTGQSTIQFQVDHTVSPMITRGGNNTITTGSWLHILITWDGSSVYTNAHIYKNGTEISYDLVNSTNGVGTVRSDSGQTFYLLNRAISGNRSFDGKYSEAAMWSSVLSSQEIAILASSRGKRMPLQIAKSNLKAFWPLDDQSAGTSGNADSFFDLSGNGNTCTGDDGAGNANLTMFAEEISTYP